jgi:hypothetical protein
MLVGLFREVLHAIEQPFLDISYAQSVENTYIVQLLQHISTMMTLKTRGKFHCQVQSCESKRKVWWGEFIHTDSKNWEIQATGAIS